MFNDDEAIQQKIQNADEMFLDAPVVGELYATRQKHTRICRASLPCLNPTPPMENQCHFIKNTKQKS